MIMVNAPSHADRFPHEDLALFSVSQKTHATDFTVAREICREGITIIKAFRLPTTRSGFCHLLADRYEARFSKTSTGWQKRARINPTWPLIFAIIFFFVLCSLRAAEISSLPQ
jgi:hypothetical protein